MGLYGRIRHEAREVHTGVVVIGWFLALVFVCFVIYVAFWVAIAIVALGFIVWVVGTSLEAAEQHRAARSPSGFTAASLEEAHRRATRAEAAAARSSRRHEAASLASAKRAETLRRYKSSIRSSAARTYSSATKITSPAIARSRITMTSDSQPARPGIVEVAEISPQTTVVITPSETASRPDMTMANATLFLGIASLVLAASVVGIYVLLATAVPAIILGLTALHRDVPGRRRALWGLILSVVGLDLAIAVLGLVLFSLLAK